VLEEHDVSELMTRTPLATLGPDASAEAAAELMRTNGIHRVLVTEGDKLVGIVSALDIATAAADHRFTNRRYVFNRDENFDRRE
jgi:predicted transcriptional regulator